jgi:pimeloyl-ACP methyl ester carboxylesterase
MLVVVAVPVASVGTTSAAGERPTSSSATFAKRVDIGNGRSMYIECRGRGSPTVLLLSGLLGASDLWHAAGQEPPTVYGAVARSTRVCAYDRPGTLRSDGELSRSDPVPQPTTTQNAVDDLDALLKAADVPGPYVLAAHSYGGLIARVFASEHPDVVEGVVFVDALGPEFRAQMTPEEWTTWKRISGPPLAAIEDYAAIERIDFDKSLDAVVTATPLRPMPVVVLTASQQYAQEVRDLIDTGQLPPDTPRDFGIVMDRAWAAAQDELAALVPDAVHITNTHSGHNIMLENAPVIIRSIRRVVNAVRAGRSVARPVDVGAGPTISSAATAAHRTEGDTLS